jgi:hypothetical protein
VSYLIALPGGLFGIPVVRHAGIRPIVIEPAEVERDRDLDVVVLTPLPQQIAPDSFTETGYVATLASTGIGTLGIAVFYPVVGTARGMALGDLDNDSRLDVIVGNTSANGLTYFRNAGGGLLQGGALAPLNGTPRSVVTVDLDNDGDRDLAAAVVVDGDGQLQVLTNLFDGGGPNALQFGPPIIPPDITGALLVGQADVDGDQAIDLVVITDDGGGFTDGRGDGGGGPEGTPASATLLRNLLEACIGDTNHSGTVDVDDLVAIILAWGRCPTPPTPCPADTNNSGSVDVDDLVNVILHWGACPDGPDDEHLLALWF